MSIEAMSLVLHHSQATGAAKLLLLGIANHQGDSGAWPAVSTLSRYAGVTERRAQQLLRALEESGELIVKRQAGGSGQYKTNLYWVNVACPEDCDGSAMHRSGVKSRDLRGEVLSTSGVKPTSPKPKDNLQEPKDKKATRLDETYRPSSELISWATETFPNVDVKKETYAFIDYWTSLPGQRGLKTSWDKTWRNWIRTAADRAPKYGRRSDVPRQTNLQRNIGLVQKIAEQEMRAGTEIEA
jgi:hypothetical protein